MTIKNSKHKPGKNIARVKWFRRKFNRRRRHLGQRQCFLILKGEVDLAENLNPDRDKGFWWYLD